MRHPWSLLRYVLLALIAASGLFASSSPAEATHFRSAHLSWRATGPESVQFTLTVGLRRSADPDGSTRFYPGTGPGGLLAVGDTFQDTFGRIHLEPQPGVTIGRPFGFSGGFRFICVAADVDGDYVVARALDPVTGKDKIDYTYSAPNNFGQPWVARVIGFESRDTTYNNNALTQYQVATEVDLTINNTSAVASLPPVLPVPNTGTSFLLPAADPEQHRLEYRLADNREPMFTQFGATYVQPPGLTIDSNTGIVNIPPGLTNGLWNAHFIIEEYDVAGAKVGQSALEFTFEVAAPLPGNSPRFFSAPTPADGVIINVRPGQRLNFTVFTSDTDPIVNQGDGVVLNSTGLPLGARHLPALPTNRAGAGQFVFSQFSWTPTQEDLGAHSITYTARDEDDHLTFTSVIIRVVMPHVILEPNGAEAYFADEEVKIQWRRVGFPRAQGVRIDLSRDGGATFPEVIVANTPDTGEFVWTTSLPFSKNCRIRIQSVVDASDFVVSEGDFVIIDGRDSKVCTGTDPLDIPDNTTTWTESPLPFNQDFIIRGLRIDVDITHPFTGDLHIELVHPDGTTVILHRQTGEGQDDLVGTFGVGAAFITTAEPLSKLYGKHSQGTWKLRIRDLISGDVGRLNRWCLQVIGLTPGTFTITSPNGGELLAVGVPYDVRWSSTNPVGTARIQLSRDGGATYTDIGVAPSAANSFTFTPSGPATTQARVRVFQADEPVIVDESDADFGIALPFLQVDNPQGGDRVSVGKPTRIRWTGTPQSNSVRIEFSKDSGLTWMSLANSAPDTGEYEWTPEPQHDTTRGRIRISANSGPARVGRTDSDFIVQTPAVAVGSPNGGETWYTRTRQAITWQTVGVDGFIRIEVSRDGGANWETIIPSTANDGVESWTVTGPGTSNARVRVTSVEEPSLFDVSDAVFTIRPMAIQVTSPNGGEAWGVGTSQTVTWTHDGVIGNVDILVSTNGGATFSTVATDVANTGTFSWTVAGPTSSQAIIKVKAHDYPVDDTSDAVFFLIGPGLTVVTPNGGEVFRVGRDVTLRWASQGVGDSVNIELSRNGGATWESLFTATANDGEEVWRVTGPDTGNARLRISAASNSSVFDSSDASFQIVTPQIFVGTPNGGETWTVDSIQSIEWNAPGVTGFVKVELTRNGGQTWEPIIASTENDGAADWAVTGPGATNCRIRITSLADTSVTDESDGPFALVEPALRLSSPHGGQHWLVGQTQNITWTSTGIGTDELIAIDLSRDGGSSWTELFTTENDGSQPWVVTGSATMSARVRVRLVDSSSVSDSSRNNFQISAAELHFTNPVKRVKWSAGTRQTITWAGSALAAGGRVDILLSRNNGRTWQVIIPDTANDGAATWNVTTPASAKARLRIVWKTDEGVQATSTPFNIVKGKKRRR